MDTVTNTIESDYNNPIIFNIFDSGRSGKHKLPWEKFVNHILNIFLDNREYRKNNLQGFMLDCDIESNLSTKYSAIWNKSKGEVTFYSLSGYTEFMLRWS